MFSLNKERMLLEVKKRTEKHGDERVNAYDAMLSGDFPNAVLLKLDEKLRGVFYAPAAQSDVEEDFYPDLQFPLMGKVAWGLEMSRMSLTVHDAEFPADDLGLSGKEIDKVHFSMKPGGTVTLSLRVILGRLEEDDLIKLLRIDNQRVPISLEQIAVEDELDNFEQVELLGKHPEDMSEARQEAENLFKAPPVTPEDVVNAESWPAAADNVESIARGRKSKTA